jgi:hypothetical protein
MRQETITRLYQCLLRLYPDSFRARYAQEMQEVFAQELAEVSESGPPALHAACLNELRDLPGAVLQAHCREQLTRISQKASQQAGWEGPLPVKELLAALMAFALPVVFILFNSPSAAVFPVSLPAILILVGILFVVGMIKGFPRWSLPYLGQALSIAGYLVLFNGLVDLLKPSFVAQLSPGLWDASTRMLLETFWAGFIWLSLLVLTLLILGFLAVLRRFRPFYQRIRQDWTLVSFILYAESVLALILFFDQQRGAKPYAIASLLLLGSGAWMYLRSPYVWQRILALFSGLSLAMWVAFIGRWLVLPGLQGSIGLRWPETDESFAELETWRLALQWGWIVVLLLVPALLNRLHPGKRYRPSG